MLRSALQIVLASCLIGCATQDQTYTSNNEAISQVEQVEVEPLPEVPPARPEVALANPGVVSAPLAITPPEVTPATAALPPEQPEVAVATPQPEIVVAPAQPEVAAAPPQPEVAAAPAQPEVAVAPTQPEVISRQDADSRVDQTSEAEPAVRTDEALCRDEAEKSNNALGPNRVKTELFGITPEMHAVYDRCLIQRRSQRRG
jgi:hypothetical protein